MDKILTCSNGVKHNKYDGDNFKNYPQNSQQNKIPITSEADVKNNRSYYLSREKAYMLEKYGKEMYKWNKENKLKIQSTSAFLDKHSLTPEARKKMVDWMLEVFTAYNCEPRTFELAVNIMDSYILKTKKKLKDENIHLIGLASIYIASKMEEKIPMRLYHIVKYCGKNVFTNKEIIEKEKEILMTIDFDFFSTETYDYLMTFFWDLKVNNEANLIKFKAKDIVDKYMDFCVFLSKLTLYDYEFITYDASTISIAILSLGYDCLKKNDIITKEKTRHFLRDWIYYLIYELKLSPNDISQVYSKIYELYKIDILLTQQKYEEENGEDLDNVSYLCKLYSNSNYL